MAKEYTNKKCKICGKSICLFGNNQGSKWRVACSNTNGGTLFTCWVGPLKRTKREALEAWNPIMNTVPNDVVPIEVYNSKQRLLLLV